MIKVQTKIRVRYAETDTMGVAYHGNYLTWFEVGRVDLLDKMGTPYRLLENDGYMLPVAECHVKFLKPSRFDDVLTIESCIEEKPRVKIVVHYNVYLEGNVICKGHTVHAFIGADGQLRRPPENFMKQVNELWS